MRSAVTEEEVRRYLDLGFDALPEGDSEPRVRLLTAKAFFPWVFAAHQTDAEIAFAVEQGEEAAAMALRMGNPDRASGALDGVGSTHFVRHRFGEAKEVGDRRLAIVDELGDPWEVGDVYSVACWVRTDIGLYHEAIELAERGYERTREHVPSVALHCQAWSAMALFRLGDWDAFLSNFDLVEELLGDRRDDPPYFAARPFGAVAFVHDTRGNQVAADRVLELIERLRARESERGQVVLALAALVYARRGNPETAWSYLLHGSPEAAWDPMRLEFGCDVVAELGHWDRAPEVLDRTHAGVKGGLLSLPASIARLEGRSALAAGDPRRAVELLTKARQVFGELGARWDRAYTDLFLGEALIADGEAADARSHLEDALLVFEDLRTPREIGRAKELLAR
jgi:tetratricopeptide (TPR) repeat protein